MPYTTRREAELVRNRIHIPTLPTTLARVYGILEDPEADIEQVAAALGADPAVAAKVLRLANVATFSLIGPIRSLPQAVITIGLHLVRSVVICATLLDNYDHLLGCTAFDVKRLWRRWIRTGAAARAVGRLVRPRLRLLPDECYAVGLLQDAGVLVLLDHDARGFMESRHEADRSGRPVLDCELEVLRADHAELGARLFEAWKLPDCFVQAARHHHDGNPGEEGMEIARLARLADQLGHRLDGASPLEEVLEALDGECLAALELDPERHLAAFEELAEECAAVDVSGFLGR